MLLVSCSKDTYEELVQETKNPLKVKNLKARDLKKQGNLVKKLDHFKAFTKLQNLNHKTETSSIYDFSIDTKNFKLIENDRVKYYTFEVNRTIDNGMLENLQITKKTDGTYVAKLLQYSLPNSEKALLLSGGRLDVNGKLKVVNIEDPDFLSNINLKFRGDCFDMIITTQENLCALGGHSYGEACPLPANLQPKPDSNVYTIVSIPCDNSGGGDLGDGVVTTPVGGGGGTSTLVGFDAFLTSLSAEQQQWLDNQSETTQGNIYSYLNVNNYNTTSSNYVSNLINYLLQNPQPTYTQSNYPGLQINMPFEWWKDNQYIKNNLKIFFEIPNVFEILLFNQFPAFALLHVENAITALNTTNELTTNNPTTFPQSGLEDGKADAFRHAYWNALDTAEFGALFTEMFTSAHEAFSNGLPKTMDLFNNQKGRENSIINNFGFFTDENIIKNSIILDVNTGKLRYIKNNLITPTNN